MFGDESSKLQTCLNHFDFPLWFLGQCIPMLLAKKMSGSAHCFLFFCKHVKLKNNTHTHFWRCWIDHAAASSGMSYKRPLGRRWQQEHLLQLLRDFSARDRWWHHGDGNIVPSNVCHPSTINLPGSLAIKIGDWTMNFHWNLPQVLDGFLPCFRPRRFSVSLFERGEWV